MHKEEIINLLEDKHQQLFDWLNNQPIEKWEQGPNDKWTEGQHILHLVDSIKKVNHAMSFPKFALKYKFGTSNRAVRNYDDVVNRYLDKLGKNKEKAKKFNSTLTIPTQKERKKLLTTLLIQQKKLQHKTLRWKDKDLDNLVLPHPLMGKMPVREILMFMGYHTEHHTKDLMKNY